MRCLLCLQKMNDRCDEWVNEWSRVFIEMNFLRVYDVREVASEVGLVADCSLNPENKKVSSFFAIRLSLL